MKETYWIKKLYDGAEENGAESLIKKGLASWTRGRQDIVEVQLGFGGTEIRLGATPVMGRLSKWKQFDNCEFRLSTGKSRVVSREVRCTVNGHRFLKIEDYGGVVDISLGQMGGKPIPPEAEWVQCLIADDGQVLFRYIMKGED